jgi:hypothetical protein
MMPTEKRLLAAIILIIEVPLAVLAWRDLARRRDEDVRGRKKLWRTFILMNPGNSLLYWLGGRRARRADSLPAADNH